MNSYLKVDIHCNKIGCTAEEQYNFTYSITYLSTAREMCDCARCVMGTMVGERGNAVTPLLTSQDTLTKSCPNRRIGRTNGLLRKEGDLSMGNVSPNGALSLGNVCPSFENDRRNGSFLRNDRRNGTFRVGYDRPNGALSLENARRNGLSLGNVALSLSLEKDCPNGALSMGKVCSSW